MLLRKRVVTTISIIAVATVIIGGGLGVNSMFSINRIKTDIRAEQQSIDDRFAMHRYIRQEVAKINEARRRLRQLADMSLVESSELDLITALENNALEAGVEQDISLETVNQVAISSWEKMVPIRLQVTGSYPAFSDYLRRLDKLDYLISIQSFNIMNQNSSRFDSDSLGMVRGDLIAQVYWTSENRPAFLSSDDLKISGKTGDSADTKPLN